MTTNPPRDEDGGYGSSSLVGSDRAGLRSAIESREAVRDARRNGGDNTQRDDGDSADLGRLADGTIAAGPQGAGGDTAAGPSTLGDTAGGKRAAAGRTGGDRASRDGGNSLQGD